MTEQATEARGLSPKAEAHEKLAEGERYEPWVRADQSPPELTWRAMGFGVLFGVLFGAADACLGLVAGLTIFTSIPFLVVVCAFFFVSGEEI